MAALFTHNTEILWGDFIVHAAFTVEGLRSAEEEDAFVAAMETRLTHGIGKPPEPPQDAG